MGYMGTDYTTEEYVKEMQNAYSSPWFTPTPSGSNFGDTVTGQQDIYVTPEDRSSFGYTSPAAEREANDWQARQDAALDRMLKSQAPTGGGYTDYGLPSAKSPLRYESENEKMQEYLDKKRAAEDADWARPRTGGSGGSSGGRGGGGGMTLGQARTTVTTPTRPRGPMPEAGEMPTFSAPTRDQGRIKELTQQKSAAGLRAMRAQIQKAMGQGYRNPNVKRMTLRDALAGYGQGIENVMTGAQTAATGEYNTEYASAYDTAGKNWQTAYQTKMQDWQNKVNDYFKQYGTVTSTA